MIDTAVGREIMTRQVDTPAPVETIGLKRDQIVQRYLARKIYREFELLVVETDGTEHTGFITGIDDRCLQLSTSPQHAADEPRSVLVFFPIRRIEETGRRLTDLEHDHVSKIRTYSNVLWRQCESFMKSTGQLNHNGSRRPKPPGETPMRPNQTEL